jgi:streptogramin lyase
VAVGVGLAVALAGGISAAVIVPGGSAEPAPAPVVAANSLVQLDPGTGRVVAVTGVGDTPVSLALTPKAVWVVNRGDRTVSRVDRRTHLVRAIGGVPYAFDVAADLGSNIWVSDSKDPVVARISAGTSAFPDPAVTSERIAVPPRAGRVTAAGGYLWVANAVGSASPTNDEVLGAPLVSRIDLRSHRIVSTIRTGQLPLVIASGYGSVWVGESDASLERSSLAVIDTGSSRAETIDSGISQPVGIAAGEGSIWVLKFDGTLDKIDPQTRRVLSRTPVGPELEVLSIAVGAGYVWVTNRADFSVSKIDPHSGKVVRTIRLGRVGIVPCGIAAEEDAVWVTMGSDTDCASPATR